MIRVLMLTFLMLVTWDVDAKSITTINITEATLKATLKLNGSCLRYQVPTRFCIWSTLHEVNFTPVLNHYLPDLVVTVYRNKGENPWLEASALFDKTSTMVQEKLIKNVGSGNQSFSDQHEQQIIFKEADVVGNPALIVLPQYAGKLLLNSTATPMYPYYQSMIDSLLWRGSMPEALPEETQALAFNLIHHIGTGLIDLGGVYPHEGSVMGNNDVYASMVIAQRAADLLSNDSTFGHVHQSLSNSCGQHCKAASIQENNKDTLFQMISPIEQDDCAVLGTDDAYSNKMLNEEGAYVWIVWRHYQGCQDGEGKFVGVTP
jgi:integrating conjugative element protein (TIGR03756 family)